jgi:tRNA (guanine-N7-)-methyltransferase
MARRGSTRHGELRQSPDPGRRTSYGRRHGRRLRPGLKALLEDLLPRLEIVLPEGGGMLDPAALFDTPSEDRAPGRLQPENCQGFTPRLEAISLEIGFGAGEHLAWQAERHPRAGFLGAEYFVNGLAGLLREVQARALTNVRIHQGDGRDLLDALPEGSLDRVFILFPDPWPKARHHKRRFVRKDALDRLAAVMKDGVELRLATDDMGYLRWMLERLIRHPEFEWLARDSRDWRERPTDWPPTRYELKALRQGRRPVYLRFRRRPRRT